jgi:uncharacterized membrane protein YfcA
MLILIYLLSLIIGILGTYYVVKLAVKHGVESANKPNQEKASEESTDDKLKVSDVLIGLVFLLVFVVGFFSGVLD